MITELAAMTQRERDELSKVVRLRARVAKSSVAQREAELLADVESQLAAAYRVDDAAWADVTAEAKRAVDEADAAVAARCRELGIRDQFRPQLYLSWSSRGENAMANRRAELRRVAVTQIAAAGKAAKAKIEAKEAEILTTIVSRGLISTEAREFLDSIPTPMQLMPTLTIAELEAAYTPSRTFA